MPPAEVSRTHGSGGAQRSEVELLRENVVLWLLIREVLEMLLILLLSLSMKEKESGIFTPVAGAAIVDRIAAPQRQINRSLRCIAMAYFFVLSRFFSLTVVCKHQTHIGGHVGGL